MLMICSANEDKSTSAEFPPKARVSSETRHSFLRFHGGPC